MRIALVTEQFATSTAPAAHVTREVVARLTGRGHDVVVLALPLVESTTGMVGADFLASMRDGAVLVNVGRGAAVVGFAAEPRKFE